MLAATRIKVPRKGQIGYGPWRPSKLTRRTELQHPNQIAAFTELRGRLLH